MPFPSSRSYLEVFGQKQLAGPQEVEDVAKNVPVPVDEVVLLQAVQHDGLGAVKQAADPVEVTPSSELPLCNGDEEEEEEVGAVVSLTWTLGIW